MKLKPSERQVVAVFGASSGIGREAGDFIAGAALGALVLTAARRFGNGDGGSHVSRAGAGSAVSQIEGLR